MGTSSCVANANKAWRPDLYSNPYAATGTRLSKLDNGEYDAIILASAGLIRLGLAERITDFVEVETSLPAAGQGAIGIECRADDKQVQQLPRPPCRY